VSIEARVMDEVEVSAKLESNINDVLEGPQAVAVVQTTTVLTIVVVRI
jgi:hypothetical protein